MKQSSNRRYNYFLKLCIFLSGFLFAQDVYSQKQFSLAECVQMALDNNLQLVAMENNLENSEISLRQSRHARYPSLSGSVNFGNSFGRTIDPTSNSFITQSILSNGLSLNTGVLLFNGFRINNTITQSKLNTLAIAQDKEQLRRDIMLNVATSFLNILFAKENITIAENQLAQTLKQKELVSRTIQVGNLPENAIFDVEAQIALNEQSLVSARNNLDIALLTLKQMMRLDVNIPFDIQIPNVFVDGSFFDMLSLEEVMDSAFKNQPGLEAGRLRIQVAEKGAKIAEAEFYPTLGAGFNLITNFSNRFQQLSRFDEIEVEQDITFNGQPVTIGIKQQVPVFESIPYFNQLNNNLSYGVGVSLNIPIYSNYSARAAKERAIIAKSNAENNYEIQKDNLKVTVAQSFLEAKAAKARYDASEKSLRAQNNLYQNALKRAEAGSLNTFELARLKTLFDTAQTNLLISKYDFIFRLKVLDFYLGKPLNIN